MKQSKWMNFQQDEINKQLSSTYRLLESTVNPKTYRYNKEGNKMPKIWEKYVNAQNKCHTARKSIRHLQFTRHNSTNIEAENLHQMLLN